MTKKGHYLKMRYSSDLLFAGNEHHTCVWRALGGQRWTTVTSILVVTWITSGASNIRLTCSKGHDSRVDDDVPRADPDVIAFRTRSNWGNRGASPSPTRSFVRRSKRASRTWHKSTSSQVPSTKDQFILILILPLFLLEIGSRVSPPLYSENIYKTMITE